jgi:hypothetical protein
MFPRIRAIEPRDKMHIEVVPAGVSAHELRQNCNKRREQNYRWTSEPIFPRAASNRG